MSRGDRVGATGRTSHEAAPPAADAERADPAHARLHHRDPGRRSGGAGAGRDRPGPQEDHIFVVALLAVVYVSWQHGFGPGIACLGVAVVGYAYFFVPPRHTFVRARGSATSWRSRCSSSAGWRARLWARRSGTAQRRARVALATAVARREETGVGSRPAAGGGSGPPAARNGTRRRAARNGRGLARLNAFLDNAPLGIAFFDPDLRYVRINAYLAAANGKPVEEHTGRHADRSSPRLPAGGGRSVPAHRRSRRCGRSPLRSAGPTRGAGGDADLAGDRVPGARAGRRTRRRGSSPRT